MLIKEYLLILSEAWHKYKDFIWADWTKIKEKNKQYIKSFKFSNYLKNDVFNSNIFINLIYFISLYFILKILYDFFSFVWYTIDLIFNWFLKWFFFIIYRSLDEWETHIFKNLYEFRKNSAKSKLYKREKGLLANSRAKFFKKYVFSLDKDFSAALKLGNREHSVIIKYYNYFSVWISSIYKLIRFKIRLRISRIRLTLKMDPMDMYVIIKELLKVIIKIIYNWFLIIILFIIDKTLIFISTYVVRGPILYIYKKYSLFLRAYKLRKKIRLKYYTFLYINYFFYYKKRSNMENLFSMLSEKELIKYTDQAMLLTFNIYSFNFKFIYLWHFYIKRVPYLSYLEKRYKKLNRYDYFLAMDYKHSRVILFFYIIWFFEFWCRYLPIIIPIFDKYYIKYVTKILKFLKTCFYYIISVIAFILTFPFILITYCYNSIKNFFKFYKYFKIFIKELFK